MAKEKKKNKRIAFWILFGLSAFVFFAFLELSKNTLLGWGLAALAFAVFALYEIIICKERKIVWKLCGWLVLAGLLYGITVLSAPPYKLVPAVDVKNPTVTEELTINEGKITGVYNKDESVEVYAGIPYAKAPVGELRWKEPQEPEKWNGVRACDHFGPMSMQKRNSELYNSLTSIIGYHYFKITPKDNYREEVSEDSLYLNVWKPAGDVKDAAVLVFIHGGYLTSGQASFSEYRGEDLAKKGIIVVNFAYRLGVFGYYANDALIVESDNRTTGNYGLLDQIQALKWVQKNIAAFGGDPSKVTIAGESAGSSSVNALCVSPLAKGLFRYAIGESSSISMLKPYHTFRFLNEAAKTGDEIMKEMNCESIAQMRALSADTLVNTKFENSAITIDGYAITELPYMTYSKGNNNEEALLNGFNSHEANVFNLFNKVDKAAYESKLTELFGSFAPEVEALYPYDSKELDYKFLVEKGGEAKGTYDYVLGGAWFAYGHYKWSNLVADEGRPVYQYCFTMDNRALRANHGGEMPYAYGNLWRHKSRYKKKDFELSETMQNYWVNFVKTGNPNGEGLPEWQEFSVDRTKVQELGENVGPVDNMYNDLYPIIDKSQEDY